jgi:hypothetical protein
LDLLGYDAVSLGDWFPMFLRHCSFETSGNTHWMTVSYPEDLFPHKHCYKNLKSHSTYIQGCIFAR